LYVAVFLATLEEEKGFGLEIKKVEKRMDNTDKNIVIIISDNWHLCG